MTTTDTTTTPARAPGTVPAMVRNSILRRDVFNPRNSTCGSARVADLSSHWWWTDNSCKAEREPEVRNWLQRLEKELCRAAELHDAVRDRISCVLRDEPPSAGNDAQPEEQLTPLASQIRENVRKLEGICGGYERMLNRIEL